jgi:metallo-beta-lactamase family protein
MPLRLTFHGASRCVTGSCFRLETDHGQLLVDCGMFQGPKTEKELNYRPFPFIPSDLDAVILSHAHIDHAGLLPKLTKHGYRGPIYATPATVDLAGVMLPDSAYIQEMEVEQLNRRNARKNQPRVEPIYRMADATRAVEQFREVGYATWFDPLPGVRARFWNAGHLLGSASVEVEAKDGERTVRILFSADIGPDYKLLHPDPTGPSGLDYILCEGTYGDRDRIDATAENRRIVLCDEVRAAINPRGAMLIPSFAVERAQELISDLVQLMREGQLPEIPIYVDSPLASKATQVFAEHAADLDHGDDLIKGLKSRNVRFTQTVEESKALDRLDHFHIVIAASGMCEAGRIRHRLKNWIWRDAATVLLVGFQAQGTLGRIIKDGATEVRIQGEAFKVRARIRAIDLYSGHADGPELRAWIEKRLPLRHQLFLIHGEVPALLGLQARLAGILDPERIVLPAIDQAFDLTPVGAKPLTIAPPPRVGPDEVGHLDWHNDVSKLLLDVNAALSGAADDRARKVIVRRLRRALEEEAR